MHGFILASSTPPPAPRITIFHHILDTSSKSYPRRWRGIFCPCFGLGWIHCCAFDPPASPVDNDFSSYAGHFFQELSSTLAWDFLANLPSESQADLRKEMLRRCFAKRDQSGGACLVLLAKLWKISCHMSKIYAKDSRSKEVSTGPTTAVDPQSMSHRCRPSFHSSNAPSIWF